MIKALLSPVMGPLAGAATGIVLLASVLATPAMADDYADALSAMCEQTKSCALAQMEAQMGDVDNMTEDMKAMVMTSLNSMCDGLEQGYSVGLAYQDMKNAATACMKSIAALSCESLMSGENDKTPECITMQEMAKNYE